MSVAYLIIGSILQRSIRSADFTIVCTKIYLFDIYNYILILFLANDNYYYTLK